MPSVSKRRFQPSNIIGSNIFNTLFILGLSAALTPLVVDQKLIRLDVPIMIGVSVLIWLLGWNGVISAVEGGLLFGGLLIYIGFLIWQSRREAREVQQEYEQELRQTVDGALGWLKNIGFAVGGLALLVLGSEWLVDSAVTTATYFGVSELIVGLTIVAAGTSLPEVVTSVIASLEGERDIAVGNVVGSNLFNLMGVLGVFGLMAPNGVIVSPGVLQFDLPVLILVSLVCLPIFFTGFTIGRGEGILLLGYYGVYAVYLVLTATEHQMLSFFNAMVLYGAIPLTVLILGISVWRAVRSDSS